jgi:predicted  nucleic acid-binding Zn-ribbon protein
LKSRYSLEKIPKKLQKFTELDFDSFKKVLKLKKLSLEDEEELMSWFNKKHTALSDLQSQIDSLDREIDEMVFDLYGLSDEEREIVLAG